jgi:8-oxo-dGTP pyrophosphatase MutT (NUDIX family)
MLLFCARKKKKVPHHQLAGGHVDEHEFLVAAKSSSDCHTQLLLAAQMGAARELFEETGMDLREQLHRLEPAALRSEDAIKEKGDIVLTCELKKRLYFFLHVTNDDFPIGVHGKHNFTHPMTTPGNELLVSFLRLINLFR